MTNKKKTNNVLCCIVNIDGGRGKALVLPNMKMIAIDCRTLPDPEMLAMARQMYELLGFNMTRIVPGSDPNWRSPAEFEKWYRDVLLAGLKKGTRHLLLFDGQGLRGYVSFTVPERGDEVYLNEIQIRPSAQSDGTTLRRCIKEFVVRIGELPHSTIRTYANQLNERSRRLIQKAGFQVEAETPRGVRFTALKIDLIKKMTRRKNGWKNKVSEAIGTESAPQTQR